MLKVTNIDHVAIAVPDLTPAALQLGRLFGLSQGARETVANQQTDVLFLHPGNADTAVELICPSAPGPAGQTGNAAGNSSLQRFLAKRGAGLHHICFAVEDLAAALGDLKASGVPLIDEQPRPGARGHLVAFIHPRATGGVLIELCQKVQGDSA
jgi:methylmalonyl-CoA/ethylmalonyl-CoA epimerase